MLAICNTNGSQIPRECDAVLYTRAGPEIGVASTKTFLAQIAANYLVGLALAQARGTKYPDEVAASTASWRRCRSWSRGCWTPSNRSRAGAAVRPRHPVLFLGRHVGYPVALEGALKLKELAYMHAEGFAAGELKHGPIALIEDGLPVIVVMPSPKNRGDAARQAAVQHPRDPGPRCDHHRHRRGGRRHGPALRRSPDRDPGGVNAFPAAAVARSRCRCSPRARARPAATTSTSRATWPSPSPSSRPSRTQRTGESDPGRRSLRICDDPLPQIRITPGSVHSMADRSRGAGR